jgi:hypothetical protein
MFILQKKLLKGEVIMELIEKADLKKVNLELEAAIHSAIEAQKKCWSQTASFISDLNDLELALTQRDALGFAMMEIRIMQMYGRMHEVSLHAYDYDLKKSDLHLRNSLNRLSIEFGYKNSDCIFPKEFFWRKNN